MEETPVPESAVAFAAGDRTTVAVRVGAKMPCQK